MFKKSFALLLAIVLILGFGTITAFAEPNPNDATATGNIVKISKIYKIENEGTTNPEETFYLVQKDKEVTDSGITSKDDIPDLVEISDSGYTGADSLVGKIGFAAGEATLAGVSKDIDVTLPAYTAVGVYTYTLEEVDNAIGGVTYLGNEIKLVVTVMVNDEGKYYVEGIHCEENFDFNNENGEKTDEFTNIYKATSTNPLNGGLSFTKTVSGNLGDRDKYFDFTVTFTGATGINYANATTVTVSGGSHSSNPATVDVSSGSATVNFKLKHGETIRFGNVPYGMTYTYSEASYTSDGYQTAYPQIGTGVIDDTSGEEIQANDTSGTINFAAKNYGITNTKNGTVDTGIILNNLPYIIALAVVLVGGVVLVVYKKRKNAADYN